MPGPVTLATTRPPQRERLATDTHPSAAQSTFPSSLRKPSSLNTKCVDCGRQALAAGNASIDRTTFIDSRLIRMSFMLISRLSPTTVFCAEEMLFNSSAVPKTIRRCILRPSGPASRHLKHHTCGPRSRRSTVTLPSCISSPPFAARLKQRDMRTGVIKSA